MPSKLSNDSAAPSSAGKKGASILPPNDPARKDWGILSDSLGLPQHAVPSEGATPEQASAEMKALLLKVVANAKAYEALIMKCAGNTIAGKMREDAAGRSSFDEVMSFLKSRLWNRRSDGAKTVSRKGREHSSNDVIQAWDPIAGGIGKYVQVQVSNILNRDWKQAQMDLSNGNKVSLEVLAAKGRHLDTSGRIFESDSAAGGDDSDAPEYVEQDSAFQQQSERFSAAQAGRGEEPNDTTEGEAGEQDEVAELEVSETKRAFDVALLASQAAKNNSAILKTTEHPDYQVLATALVQDAAEPELDADGRSNQLRELGRRAISLHYADSPELAEMLDAADSWNPSEVTFARYFPEACEHISKSLNEHGELTTRQLDAQFEFTMDFVAVSDELNRQAKSLKARPAGMSALEWEEIRDSVDSWFGAVCDDPEQLLSTERPDYLALCALTGRKVQHGVEPEQLANSLKDMYREWMAGAIASAKQFGSSSLRVLSDNHEAVAEMNKRMEGWDPLTHGFANEVMVTHLNEIRHEQQQREDERRRQEAEVLAEETKNSHSIKARPVRIPASQPELFGDADYSVTPGNEFGAPKALPTPHTSNEPTR